MGLNLGVEESFLNSYRVCHSNFHWFQKIKKQIEQSLDFTLSKHPAREINLIGKMVMIWTRFSISQKMYSMNEITGNKAIGYCVWLF